MNVMKLCGFCQQPADLLCSRCLEVYCSMECQIQDWADHKRVCIVVPKLYRNDRYLEILARGVTLPLKVSNMVGPGPSGTLQNNSRSLKPMRKPNVPLGAVEVAVNREPASQLIEASVTDYTPPPSKTSQVTSNTEKNENTNDSSDQSTSQNEIKIKSSAKLKLDTLKNHQQKLALINPPANGTAMNQSKPWLLHFPLERKIGEWFEVIVECVVPKHPKQVWVMLACHEAESDKLLRDIHGQLSPKSDSIKYDEIEVDDIFAAPYEDIYYRVVILEKTDPSKSLVKIRLIDYGNELILPSTDLRVPLTLMKNLRAFAFLVDILNLDRKLDVSERIRIKIVRSEPDRKIVEIEQLPPNTNILSLIGDANEKSGEGGILAIISSRILLVLLTSSAVKPFMKILFNQLVEAAAEFTPVENPKVGDIICIDLAEIGWSRALIIEQHDGHHLVYTIDNGTVELVARDQEIRTLPDEYKSKPRLVLQMVISKVIMNEEDFKRICCLPGFAFTFEQLTFNKEQHSMKALIKDADGNRQLAEVDFQEFMCDLKQVDINYWPHIPQDKSIVRITSVLDVGTLITCPHDKIDIYTDLLQTVLPNLKKLSTAPPNNVIVVGVIDNTMPYRARVLKSISPSEVEVLDLDNGSIKQVTYATLYVANAFVCNLPVYPMKIQIRDLNLACIKNKDVIIEQLMAMRSEKRKLKLMFEEQSYMCGVKLIDINTNRSLAIILMEQHDKIIRETEEAERKKREQQLEEARQRAADEARANVEKERLERERKEAERKKREQQLEEARQRAADEARAKVEKERLERERKAATEAAEIAKQQQAAREEDAQLKKVNSEKAELSAKLTIDDLKVIELPVTNSDVKLSILDDGDLKHNVLTVCEFNDENLKRYAKLNAEVNKIASGIGGESYSPEAEELCVGVFAEDKLWYRAVCLQVDTAANEYVVQFVDYGNVAMLNRESIRKLPKELNFVCVAHTCSIKMVDKSMEKLAQQQAKLGYVVASEISKESGLYILKF